MEEGDLTSWMIRSFEKMLNNRKNAPSLFQQKVSSVWKNAATTVSLYSLYGSYALDADVH